MATPVKIKTSIYLAEDLHWQLKELAVKKRISDTAAMEEAVGDWCRKHSRAEMPQRASDLRDALIDVFENGDESLRKQLNAIVRQWQEHQSPSPKSEGQDESKAGRKGRRASGQS